MAHTAIRDPPSQAHSKHHNHRAQALVFVPNRDSTCSGSLQRIHACDTCMRAAMRHKRCDQRRCSSVMRRGLHPVLINQGHTQVKYHSRTHLRAKKSKKKQSHTRARSQTATAKGRRVDERRRKAATAQLLCTPLSTHHPSHRPKDRSWTGAWTPAPFRRCSLSLCVTHPNEKANGAHNERQQTRDRTSSGQPPH